MNATRSHSSSATVMSRVVRNTVRPSRCCARMRSLIRRALTGSRPAVGSSHEDQPGVVEQCTCHAEPRLHPFGVLRDEHLPVILQPDQIEQRLWRLRLVAVERPEVGQVLQAGQLQIVVRELERHADLLVVVGAPRSQILAEHGDFAAVAP